MSVHRKSTNVRKISEAINIKKLSPQLNRNQGLIIYKEKGYLLKGHDSAFWVTMTSVDLKAKIDNAFFDQETTDKT